MESSKALESKNVDFINPLVALTGFNEAIFQSSPDTFAALIEKISFYALCTAILKSPKDILDKLSERTEFLECILKKLAVPSFFKMLADPEKICIYPKDFIVLHQKIADDLLDNKNRMLLCDYETWLAFLNQALKFAPNEETENKIRATCMQLNCIATSKTLDPEKEALFQNNARNEASKLNPSFELSPTINALALSLINADRTCYYATNKERVLFKPAEKADQQSAAAKPQQTTSRGITKSSTS